MNTIFERINCFGSRKSPVQIWAPRPVFVRNVVENEDCLGVAAKRSRTKPTTYLYNRRFELLRRRSETKTLRLGRPVKKSFETELR